jgi:hypothetical protein
VEKEKKREKKKQQNTLNRKPKRDRSREAPPWATARAGYEQSVESRHCRGWKLLDRKKPVTPVVS